jgi:L-lysine 6-transaminase
MNINKEYYSPKYAVEAESVLHELGNYMLADGFEIVYDVSKSHGVYLHDSKTGKDYLDFFTCFASNPIGLNHPKMTDPAFIEYLGKISVNKPSNSDLYSEAMASFVKTFFAIAVPDYFTHSFYIEGGALAIENALKVAFDWKVKKNFKKGYTIEKGHKILHFNQAFHGRSGYTMSLTNTDPNKTALYPKFDWPRVSNPFIVFPIDKNLEDLIERENKSIREIKQAFINNPDDIAAIIIEPIQGEGGDNHFRPEFLAHQQLGVKPDILAFGKKMQVCGILATNRVDEVPDNVFRVSSRINSTWGGSLTDMVRATRYLEIIQEDNILENVKHTGDALQARLLELQQEFPMIISNCRGRGLFSAFDFPDPETRKKFLHNCFDRGLIILACGKKSVRFRPALTLQIKELEEGMNIIRDSIISL